MTNSGSSANLMGIKALDLAKGSKVITPSLTFLTTVAPLVQSGLIPYLKDVNVDTLKINTDLLKSIDKIAMSAICISSNLAK